ncbi:hypothetical protein ACSBR1_019970 [Camellia fascicularis]
MGSACAFFTFSLVLKGLGTDPEEEGAKEQNRGRRQGSESSHRGERESRSGQQSEEGVYSNCGGMWVDEE